MPKSVSLAPGQKPPHDPGNVIEQYFTPERWAASSLATAGELEWFTNARFGLFVHLGVSSLRGEELGWGRHTHLPPDGGEGPIADEEYDNLYRAFRLENFDAGRWVSIAKAAGMKYIVVITKHHDGFHMWDTACSDYKITRSPFGRDYVGEVVAACHAAGMPVGLYYSQRDWYHRDYDPCGKLRGRDHKRYIAYMHETVRELLTWYGKIDILWFDAAWWGGMFVEEHWESEAMVRLARRLQPGILINNRASIPGDFDTPEQQIGSFQDRRPWESCMTIGSGWAWRPNDQTRSFNDCLALLVRAAAGDGNLLLNLGPRSDGEFEPVQVERLEAMGRWLANHGESIYSTRGGPFLPGAWGGSTRRGNRVWLHVLDWQGLDTLTLPPLQAKILGAKLLSGPGVPAVRQTPDAVSVTLDPGARDEADTLISLDLDRPA